MPLYLPAHKVMDLVGISRVTLGKWANRGRIRVIDPNGRKLYDVHSIIPPDSKDKAGLKALRSPITNPHMRALLEDVERLIRKRDILKSL